MPGCSTGKGKQSGKCSPPNVQRGQRILACFVCSVETKVCFRKTELPEELLMEITLLVIFATRLVNQKERERGHLKKKGGGQGRKDKEQYSDFNQTF